MRRMDQYRQEERRACPKRLQGVSAVLLAAALTAGLLAGCASSADSGNNASSADSDNSASSAQVSSAAEASTMAAAAATEASNDSGSFQTDSTETAASEADSGWKPIDTSAYEYDGAEIRVGSLKGPTTMGIVNLMKASDDGQSAGNYSFDMESDPSAIVASVASGDFDIAMIPANLGATLYNKTQGGVEVIDINTLGVLYCVTADESIQSISDFSGKTVLTTGQGATPEYVLNYLLEENHINDCTLEFHSEATEIAAVLKDNPDQIAVLPQPFVTAAEVQNDQLHTAFSLTDEWDKVAENGSKLITGATIVRTEFLQNNPDAVRVFLAEHAESAELAVNNVDSTAQLVADYGIIEKAPVAKKALPECGIVCITGDEMKSALEGYLQVLFDADSQSVGGTLPSDDFYCTFQAD